MKKVDNIDVNKISYSSLIDLPENETFKSHFFSFEQENRLLNLMKDNNCGKLREEIDIIFSLNTSDEKFSIITIQHLATDLFNLIRRILIEDNKNFDNEFAEEALFAKNIFRYNDVEIIKQVVKKVYVACANSMTNRIEDAGLVEQILDFIQANYSNKNFNIKMIANKFDLSQDFVSKKFKEVTGVKIGEYINNIRIVKSIDLLLDLNNLIITVAEMSGFATYRTYVRVFTKFKGITPKKYRDMHTD